MKHHKLHDVELFKIVHYLVEKSSPVELEPEEPSVYLHTVTYILILSSV
jgi:hypothetical protein